MKNGKRPLSPEEAAMMSTFLRASHHDFLNHLMKIEVQQGSALAVVAATGMQSALVEYLRINKHAGDSDAEVRTFCVGTIDRHLETMIKERQS